MRENSNRSSRRRKNLVDLPSSPPHHQHATPHTPHPYELLSCSPGTRVHQPWSPDDGQPSRSSGCRPGNWRSGRASVVAPPADRDCEPRTRTTRKCGHPRHGGLLPEELPASDGARGGRRVRRQVHGRSGPGVAGLLRRPRGRCLHPALGARAFNGGLRHHT